MVLSDTVEIALRIAQLVVTGAGATGVIVAWRALRDTHEWNRRQAALALLDKWNNQTSVHRKAVERLMPGVLDTNANSGDVVELTGARARAIYTSRPSEPDWELRFHLVELLNYFEMVATAYIRGVADRSMVEATFKPVLVHWMTVLEPFIAEVTKNIRFNPWEPYTLLINHWRTGTLLLAPETGQVFPPRSRHETDRGSSPIVGRRA